MDQDVLGRLIYDGPFDGDYLPIDRIKRETGYDVSDFMQYKTVYDRSSGKTRIRVYRYFPSLDIEMQATEADLPPIEEPKDLPKKQDMLDKYYGNPQKEKEYEERIVRFKSHIVQKDFEFEDETDRWKLKSGTYRTIEDYPEKEEDEKFLQLEDYKYRLERLSKAEAGDLSYYREIARKYERIKLNRLQAEIARKKMMHANPDEIARLNSEIQNILSREDRNIQESVETLQKQDEEYLETNNYAYNQYLSTQKSLRTLGRYGEKVPYMQLDRDDGKTSTRALNGAKSVANIFLRGRNMITAPINKAIGTYVVAPVHKIIHDSDKYSKGVYKGLPSHRYTARKEFFAEQYLDGLRTRNMMDQTKTLKPSVLQLALGVRVKAVINYRQGNIGVLDKGAKKIEADTLRKDTEERQKLLDRLSLEKTKHYLEIVAARCERNIKNAQNEEEKLDWERYLKLTVSKIMSVQRRIELNEEKHIDSIVQTDAITMKQHDETNKAHVTRVVTGVKNGIRTAATAFVGKKLANWIAENYTRRTPSFQETIRREIVVPEHTVTSRIDMSEGFLEKMTIGDIVSQSSGGEKSIARYANSIGVTSRPSTAKYVRGVAIEYDGRILSAGNTPKMVTDGLVNFQISDITEDSQLFDVLARIISSNGQKTVTSEDLISSIVNSPDPNAAFREMLGSLRVSVGKTDTGDPYGWLILDEAIEKKASIYPKLSKTIVPEKVTYVDEVVTHAGVEYLDIRGQDILDRNSFGAQAYLYSSAMGDLYEIVRRSNPELAKKTERLDRKSRKQIMEFVTNSYGFTGTKKGDYKSNYDENNMGLRKKDTSDKGEER